MCASNPCINGLCKQNNQVGSSASLSIICYCLPNYTGPTCNILIDKCAGSPCGPNGICNVSSSLGALFSCTCNPGFTGQNCASVLDACGSSPCVKGACYNNQVGGYTCTCPFGFTGLKCEVLVNNCAVSSPPCGNGGNCSSFIGGYVSI